MKNSAVGHWASILAVGVLAAAAHGQSIEGEFAVPGGSTAGDGARPALTRAHRSVSFKARTAADVSLPALDEDALRAEDDAARVGEAWKRNHRIGVVRSFEAVRAPHDLLRTADAELGPDGRMVWRAEVHSEGARALRLRLCECDLPAGAEVVVYAADDPSEAYGPLVARAAGEALWTPTVFADRVVVEVRAPAGSGEVRVAVDQVVHTYRDLGELLGLGRTDVDRPARAFKNLSCMNEVVSDASWVSDIARAVAAYGLVTDRNQVFCTGSLLNDTDPDTQVPWFLTANHCLSRASEARDIEVFWDYRTQRVGGSVPRLRDLPRTVGAELMTTDRDTDLTLLRLTGNVPADRFYAGWTFDSPSRGEAIVGVHHPEGSHMRISYGEYEGVDRQDPGLHEVTWDDGVTAPGSSGSPLYNASKQVLGQLCCGGSECDAPRAPDYYGRLDRNLERLRPFLLSDDVGGGGGGGGGTEPTASLPDAPIRAKGRGKRGRAVLKWRDVAFDETSYVVERRVGDSWQPVTTLDADAKRVRVDADPGLQLFRVGARNAAGTAWTVIPTYVRGGGVRLQDTHDPVDDSSDGAVAVDGGVSGVRVLGRGDRADWFRVDLVAGTRYRFFSDGDLDVIGALRSSPNGQVVAENDDDETRNDRDFGFSYTATRSGAHYIEVSPWSRRARGLYVLRWTTDD